MFFVFVFLHMFARPPPRCCTLTVVLALDESLPFPEPVHADAVDDHGGLLLLKRLVQLPKHTHESERGL